MNTSRLIIGWVATGLTLVAQLAWAGPQAAAVRSYVAVALAGQSGAETAATDESRRAVQDLMSRARRAMSEGNLAEADALVTQAEGMQLGFSVFHLGDTPAKARRDLESLKQQRGAAPQTPGQPAQSAPTGAAAGTQAALSQATGPANRGECDKLIVQARRALAVGDVRQATALVDRAKSMNVPYAFYEDSPDRVAATVSKYSDLMVRYGDQKNGEAFRRQHALLMLEQAEQLIAWRELDEAERLVVDARQTNGAFGPFEPQPDAILSRIAEARRQAPAQAMMPQGHGIEPLPPVPFGPNATQPISPLPQVAAETSPSRKAEVLDLVRTAREALAQGDLRKAEAMAMQAESLRVPDSEFQPQDDRPWLVLMQVQQQKMAATPGGDVQQVSGASPIGTVGPAAPFPNTQAFYDESNDATRNVPVAAQSPVVGATPAPGPMSRAMDLYSQGEEALRRSDREAARNLFQQAYQMRDELDPLSQQRLQDHLQMLSQPAVRQDGSLLNQAAAAEQLAVRQVSAEVARFQVEARRLQEADPKRALGVLEQARQMVETSQIDAVSKDVLARRVDRDLEEMRTFITTNASRIELDERNSGVRGELAREEAFMIEIQEKLALKVDAFNKLMIEQRYAEAEIAAKEMSQLAPNEPVVKQIQTQVRLVRNLRNDLDIRQGKEDAFVNVMQSVDLASTPFDDRVPIVFPDTKRWEELTKSRRSMMRSGRTKTAKEIEIEHRLRTPVSCQFTAKPLDQVMQELSKLAQVTIHLDPRGLAEEGVDSSTPVTLVVNEEIMLKSVLNLVLEPLNLSYVIKDEVLKITSYQLRDNEVFPVTYNVADLVIPIPNFVPTADMGLAGALRYAMNTQQFGGSMGFGSPSPLGVVASNGGDRGQPTVDPTVLAQMAGNAPPIGFPLGGGGAPSSGSAQPIGFGPGGISGGAGMADFDALIDLITTTVAPTTWDDVGGAGTIQEFEANLSLVISQTQDVHDEIADLLDQLRRLQDLQVTIEVRFITLSDRFFEQIGIDFDFDINDNIDRPFQIFGNPDPTFSGFPPPNPLVPNTGPPRDVQDRDVGQSVTVGLSAPGVFSADMDIPFTQNSFGLAQPQFGGFSADAGMNLGFAILSDIEAYFFIRAAQGDQRNNVLQAPKVTLFNGQQGIVSDTAQSPFVISVIPVVGDFASALQPVIVVLPEGTILTVQAVVSNDRRFVRMTVVPFFSQIGEVNTFTFTGSATTEESSSSTGPDDDTDSRDSTTTTALQGTTVQLPTFAFTTVSTTVSVPDGGTVLLGGIKRLQEGRNEFGVPILNKIPYINRLFSNVGIGRETSSLMMMVTPRIIIQEEEEALLGVQTTP